MTLQLPLPLSESHSFLNLELSFRQLVSLSKMVSMRLVIHRSPYDIHVTGRDWPLPHVKKLPLTFHLWDICHFCNPNLLLQQG